MSDKRPSNPPDAKVKKLATKREPCEWCGHVWDHWCTPPQPPKPLSSWQRVGVVLPANSPNFDTTRFEDSQGNRPGDAKCGVCGAPAIYGFEDNDPRCGEHGVGREYVRVDDEQRPNEAPDAEHAEDAAILPLVGALKTMLGLDSSRSDIAGENIARALRRAYKLGGRCSDKAKCEHEGALIVDDGSSWCARCGAFQPDGEQGWRVPELRPNEAPAVCAYCGQAKGHSKRCSVSKFAAPEMRTNDAKPLSVGSALAWLHLLTAYVRAGTWAGVHAVIETMATEIGVPTPPPAEQRPDHANSASRADVYDAIGRELDKHLALHKLGDREILPMKRGLVDAVMAAIRIDSAKST